MWWLRPWLQLQVQSVVWFFTSKPMESMLYAINISCHYFAFPEHTPHHGLHPGLSTPFPRVILNVILKSVIIDICEKHKRLLPTFTSFKSASMCRLTLNIKQTSESTNFITGAKRRQCWDVCCQGQSWAHALDALPEHPCCPFPPRAWTGSKHRCPSSAVRPSHHHVLPSSTPCLLPLSQRDAADTHKCH